MSTRDAENPIIEIVTVGREILDGRIIDTNSTWLGTQLGESGLVPRYAQRVDDEMDRIVEAFRIAAQRSKIVLVTGGLGPTADDLTIAAFARFIGAPLVLNPIALSQVEAVFKKLGREMIETQKKQALFPPGCEVIENPVGTAPGLMREDSGRLWFFLPGVPKEMKAMFEASVKPRLPRIEGYRNSFWATQFTSEGELQRKLNPVHADLPEGFEITYRTRFPENHVGLHGSCLTLEAKRAYEEAAGRISAALGPTVFSGGLDQQVSSLESVVLELLMAGKRVIGTVESCTGGLIAHRLTDIAGSSAAFWCSWVVYDNRAKENLGVDPALIRAHGAVSPEVAGAMAEAGLGQLIKMGASDPVCVATTGIAGPSGGSATKPVGLCYIAVAMKGHPTSVEEVRGRAFLQRAEYKLLFSQKALDLVRRSLQTGV